MHKAIHHILTHCGGVKSGESVFIVHDDTTRDIVDVFEWEIIGLGAEPTLMELIGIDRHGVEPMPLAAEMMMTCDLTISLCQHSLAHTKARLGARRFLSLPGYDRKLLDNPAIMVDYEAQLPIVRRFADAFTNGNSVRVSTLAGTDVYLNIAGRRGNCCPGFVREVGDLGSPPDIEANVAPHEDSAKGVAFFDSPRMRIALAGGKANTIGRPQHRILAECGVGLNPLAKISGNMLIDEGVFGSVHFGFGSNHTIGGKNETDQHLDFVMEKASLWVDGIQMLKDGELC